MSTSFVIIRRKSIIRFSRKLISGFLASLLIVQAFGPGLFAAQEADATTAITLFENGFEGNNVPNSFSQWTSQNGQWSSSTQSPNSGNRKAHVLGSTGDAVDILNKAKSTQGFGNIAFSFWYKLFSLETGDYLKVQWTGDGSNWNDLVTFDDGDEKEPWTKWEGALPQGAEDKQQFSLRFVANFNDGETVTDKFYLDDVKLIGNEIKKINICHLTNSENNPWEAIRINESAWDGGPDHEGHGDFLYNGPVNPQNQQPTKPDGDIWCEDNDPRAPELKLTKSAQYDGNHRIVYTINWEVLGNDVENLKITDTLPPWTDVAVNTMSPSTTPPLLPGGGNFKPANPDLNRSLVWDLGAQDKGAKGTITFRVEIWKERTCEIEANKVVADALFNEDTVSKTAYSEVIEVNASHCDEEPPREEPKNSCMIPNTLLDTEEFVLGDAPSAEKDLAQIFAEATPPLSINPLTDQVNIQTWDIDPNAQDAKFGVLLLGKQAGNNQVFGWYKKGVPGSFTPVFRVGDPLNGSYDALPELSTASGALPVTIPASNGSVGFAVVTDNGATEEIYFSEKALNTNDGGKDHVAVYNPNTNRYVIAFEDLPSSSWDRDYNDLVVKVVDVRCAPKELVCEPGVELLANGSFEEPLVTHNAGWDVFGNGASDLDWGVEWLLPSNTQFNQVFIPDLANLELHKGGSVNPLWSAKDGLQYAELDTDWGGPNSSISGEPASVRIYQDIPTVPGKDYLVKFAFAPRPGTGTNDNMLDVLWGGTSATGTISRDGSSETTNIWKDYVVKVTATSTMTRIAFADAGLNSSNSLGVFLDNASLQCAPACNPTSGSVVSDSETLVTKVEVGDPADDDVSDYGAVPVSVVSDIQALDGPGGSVWEANVSDANAKWIWSEDPYDADWTVNKWVTFKRTFNVVGTPESGTLKIAADNSYEVWVNGQPGVPPMVDSAEDNHSSADTWDVGSLLISGNNTLEIRVKNLELPGAPQTNNPGGLLFNLSWTAKDCGNDDPKDGNSRVIVKKYIDGEPATNDSADGNQFGIDYVTSAGSGNAVLHAGNNFVWEGPALANFQGTADVQERTQGTASPNPIVIPLGGECQPGKFRLAGYSVGTSFANAENNTVSSSVNINIQDTNAYVIIWNETCPENPGIDLTKTATYATSTGQVTFTIGWKVLDGDVSNLVITDPISTGLTFVSADNGGTHDLGTPGIVTWNLGAQVSGASGAVSFIASLDAWNSNLKWASGFEANNQGKNKNGTNIIVDRTDPTDIFGAPQSLGNTYDTVVPGSFFSLGFDAGNIVATFNGTIINGSGNDIKVYEVTGGTTYPDEKVKVEAWDGLNWVDLGLITRDGTVDLGSLSSTTKVRLTEASDKSLFENTADGYDVDAIEALHIIPNVCDISNTARGVISFGENGTQRDSATVVLPLNGSSCDTPEPPCETDCGGGNNPQYGGLIVEKIVVGSDASPLSFSLFVDGVAVVSGTPTTTVVGSHAVTETSNPDYTMTFGESCPNGIATVTLGATTTCQVINTWNPGGQGGDGDPGGSGDTSTPPTNTTGQSRRSGGGNNSGGGGSGLPNLGEVAGAFTELPGLPDTGRAPISEPQTSSLGALSTILGGVIVLLALNFVSIRILKRK